jgi:hypothetical protein
VRFYDGEEEKGWDRATNSGVSPPVDGTDKSGFGA